MRIQRFVSPLFAANAYLLSTEKTAVVVDPGAGTADQIKEAANAQDLRIDAVVATHGHADHVWDAGKISAPTFITGLDSYRLDDPATTTAGAVLSMQRALEPFQPWQKPAEIVTFPEEFYTTGLRFGDITLRGLLTPGHSEGSTCILVAGPCNERPNEFHNDSTFGRELTADDALVLTGDLIFADSVGRTDLPGGNRRDMLHSLRSFANSIDPISVLLPGHGGATTLERELTNNLYLRQARKIG